MDAPTATIKATCHARSNSLPSKSHPLIVGVEDQLQKLRSSEPAIVCKNLAALKDLVECVVNLLQFPPAQKVLCKEKKDKSYENLLDGSLRLRDMCGNIRDIFVHIKGCVQDLESSLRRRNGRESSLANEIEKYFISKRKVNRIVSKCVDNLKIVQKGNLAVSEKVRELVALVDLLREVEAVSFTVFKSLFSFVSPKSISNNLSLVSNLIKSKRVTGEEEDNDKEMANLQKIDDALYAIIRNKSSKTINKMQVQKAQKGLEAMSQQLGKLKRDWSVFTGF